MSKRTVTNYFVRSEKLTENRCLAIAADLHNEPYEDLLPILQGADALLIPGDLANRYNGKYDKAVAFVQTVSEMIPVYISIGNHDRRLPEPQKLIDALLDAGGIVLDNTCMTIGSDLVLGGLTSVAGGKADPSVLSEMEQEQGFRLLMCHHPEYFDRMILMKDIDLTVSGHAHGGQISLFGRGLYAPGQGVFPKYTAGFYHQNRLLVSRGLSNIVKAPRWFNPRELLLLHLMPRERGETDAD